MKPDTLPWRSADAPFPLSLPPFSSRVADQRLARQVACAAGAFEHGLLGRTPTSVTVVAAGAWMVVHVHESFSPVERRLASSGEEGAQRVREASRQIFEHTADALLEHVRRSTGVEFRGALAHVDTVTQSVIKTLSTGPVIDVFLLGQGLPTLGVPVNDHLYAAGIPCRQTATGNGAGRR